MTRRARVDKTARAEQDLIDIWFAVSAGSERAADATIDRIERAFETLADSPLIGAPRDDLRQGLRHVVVRPYLILHRASRSRVVIVRVIDGRRDLMRIF
jgi:toxin ParE1/3/4